MAVKQFFRKYFKGFLKYRQAFYALRSQYVVPKLGGRDETTQIGLPFLVTYPDRVFLSESVRINPGAKFINYTGNIVIKKYSVLSYGCTIVTGNHTPTVGVPQYRLGHLHLNDKERNVVIEEDVWIGANVTLLSGAHISRGCVVGANTLVNKEIPPYAVVVGTPARIIASKFTKEQILQHESELYPVEERMTTDELDVLFDSYYSGLRSIGVPNK